SKRSKLGSFEPGLVQKDLNQVLLNQDWFKETKSGSFEPGLVQRDLNQ
ncbi:14220_t:CDS:1, partial [Dentiscutata heterogama]